MGKGRALIAACLVLGVLGIPVGEQALAGPGGGTYYANSPSGGASGTALRKFVDGLPGLGSANMNNLGQYIPIAVPDSTTYRGSDYYVIGLSDYTERMHSDLPKATRLRGYYQVNGPDNTNHYLGPLIIAPRDRPVRILFRNNLPTGAAGNLFIPVDNTVMGAGLGPLDNTTLYNQNRATIHLHGGNTPWISDGTPHQWITPANDPTIYPVGVSHQDVPDMPTPPAGQATYFYTNQQSNRLMFYHDHAYGITRLNVYAGEAAGYLITDNTEEALINNGTLPNLGGVYRYGVPLVIQDKMFVPQNVAVQDALWDTAKWGQPGDLWFPHVYEPNQDPLALDGANPYGRWDYGPWFWPPMDPSTLLGPLPQPSLVPEAFMDTPVVNGTAYPYLVVQPTAYRFRILNACNDRMLNLSLWYADPAHPTEVRMVPAVVNPTFPPYYPTPDNRDGGFPDPALTGPPMIQIGTEGGFLPAPVAIPNRPVGYDYNRRIITVLNVLEKALYLGPAERADVIVDFSAVPPGSNIILYNDAPAPTPAFDTRNDYFTGNQDQTSGGGAPTTLPGYGPNTRTIMQFRVAGTPTAPFNQAALQAALPAAFAASQPPIIVPQAAYGPVYGKTLPDVYSTIQQTSMTFTSPTDNVVTFAPLLPKAIHELFEMNYGRMNAVLGTELPFTNFLTQTTIPLAYPDPPTEKWNDNGVQLWKITHNGVDTHAIHFHMVNVQLVNRVGWDGQIKPPDPNELGWKETIRMNPLEDIIVAMLPKTMTLPFAIPESVRPLNPTMPTGPMMTAGFTQVDPATGNPMTVFNDIYNFGYEYVWHCHLLGHEENDMMRPIIFRVPASAPNAASGLTATAAGTGNSQIDLAWTIGAFDNTSIPNGFRVQRSTGGPFATIATVIMGAAATDNVYTDTALAPTTSYSYRVIAFNSAGPSAASNTAGPVATLAFPAATGVTFSAHPLSPQMAGTPIVFVAAGQGGTGIYQYEYWTAPTGGAFTLARAYAADNTFLWYPATGTWQVKVNVRSQGSTAAFEATATVPFVATAPPAGFARLDFDGDGKTDMTVYRPSTGTWYILGSAGAQAIAPYGLSTDTPVPGDYDGDGKTDIAVWRGSTATWYILRSLDGGQTIMPFGASTDVPVPGDYDGDGKTDLAVYTPSTGTWTVRRSSDNVVVATAFGALGDIPVPGDYDGDGKTDRAVYRPSNGTWYILRSFDGAQVATQFGVSTDIPVPGDYDGDRKTDIAVYRPSNGTWYVVRSLDGSQFIQQYGTSGDTPVPGDYDGDGKSDIALWRPSNGTWYIVRSSDGTEVNAAYGTTGDQALKSLY